MMGIPASVIDMESTLSISLPHPPSLNHYWRRVGPRVLISRDGREYRDRVIRTIAEEFRDDPPRLEGRLAVRLRISPPDRRRRDLDNVQKPLLDALAHGGIYEDDGQIDWLLTERKPVVHDGCAVVSIEPLSAAELASHLLDCKVCREAFNVMRATCLQSKIKSILQPTA
jgi:crossover junction endodeoxyribonuclease RusA